MKIPPRIRWLRWLRVQSSFGVKINFLLGLGISILVAVGVLAHRSIENLLETSHTEVSVYAGLGHLEAFLGSIRNAFAAQRSYLLTGSNAELRAYAEARARVNRELDSLLVHTTESDQLMRLREFQTVVGDRLRFLDSAVLARVRGMPGATPETLNPPAAATLDLRIEVIAEAFRGRELQSLRSQRTEAGFNADTSSFLISWGTAFSCALLLWAMVNIHRHQTGRRIAERAVRASEAQLRLITDSVPALIGYVNREGRLLFHNRAFERWFGRAPETINADSLRGLFGEESYRTLHPYVESVLAGETGDFKFTFRTPDGEIKDLSAQFVPRREESDAVTGFYALVTDITALTEVERIKSEFVTTVSHELRTPLTSIRGSLGLLAGGVTGALPEKARELVNIAMQNCERLVRLINDILDSERMMSGKIHFSFEPIDISVIIERCLRETESFAAGNGVRMHYSAPATPVTVRADRDRLAQVMTNLLSNACKFSPSGSEVEVTLEGAGTVARVEVSDRGPGVPALLAPRLFERFMQVDATNVRRVSGTGLGLAICKGLVERMDGRIGYLPREGGGSVFFFELPTWQEARVEHG